MSDDVLSALQTDPYWQPGRAAADCVAENTAALAPAASGIDVAWYDGPVLVDCGPDLDSIGCSHCGAMVDIGLWVEWLDRAHSGDGFASLAITVPCCGASTSLDALDYDWPCGFARFRIILCNPERDGFDQEESTIPTRELGHPVHQVRTRV
ncbi:hypothetical protein [Nocardiopsis sp. LOL_012]|uniref:hypothetical protein n=1 Tax=Nocardiopsis sp. LOL_012 TaxID=3345409 RepID=UPI003A883F67